MRFLGLSDSVSLALLTRMVLILVIITALVIVFIAHEGDIAGDGAASFVLFVGYVPSLLLGLGTYSPDVIRFK